MTAYDQTPVLGIVVWVRMMQQFELRFVQSFVGFGSAVAGPSVTAAVGAPVAGLEDILYNEAAVVELGNLVAVLDRDTP